MAIDADYHTTRITALYAELANLDGRVNHSDLGRSFDFDGARRSLMEQIDYHEKKLAEYEGPFEFVTVVGP